MNFESLSSVPSQGFGKSFQAVDEKDVQALMGWAIPLWAKNLHNAGLCIAPCLMCWLLAVLRALGKIHAIKIVAKIHIFRAFFLGNACRCKMTC